MQLNPYEHLTYKMFYSQDSKKRELQAFGVDVSGFILSISLR